MGLEEPFSSVTREVGVELVSVSFYPYAELKHTWKRQGRSLTFKVSDYLKSAPEDVLTSLAWYLVSRALAKGCPDHRDQRYVDFVSSREMWIPNKDLYLSRAKSLALEVRGKVRDLAAAFDCVNCCYFSNSFTMPTLAWTTESPGRRLGYCFEPVNLLAVNRVFDCERIPAYALEFVIYHELLHIILRPDISRKGYRRHTPEFRRREREFSHYGEAKVWLRRAAFENRE